MRGMFLYLSKADAPTTSEVAPDFAPSGPPDNPVPHHQASARARRFATAAAIVGTFISAPTVVPEAVTAQVVPDQPTQKRLQVPAQVPPSFVWAEPRTRFYLPGSYTVIPGVEPADDGAWTTQLAAFRARAYLTPVADTPVTVLDGALNGALQVLYRQAISPPLNGAQVILGGSVKGQFRIQEPDLARNAFLAWSIRVVSRDGLTVRGTIVGHAEDDLEASTSLVNRQLNAAGASVSAQHGDRIIFEIGVHATYSLFDDIGVRFASGTGSDLPEDNTTASDLNCWVELPGTLIFGEEGEAFPPPYGPQIRPRNPASRPEFQFQPGIIDSTPNAPLETHPMPWLVAPAKRERGMAGQLQGMVGTQVGEPIENSAPNTFGWTWA